MHWKMTEKEQKQNESNYARIESNQRLQKSAHRISETKYIVHYISTKLAGIVWCILEHSSRTFRVQRIFFCSSSWAFINVKTNGEKKRSSHRNKSKTQRANLACTNYNFSPFAHSLSRKLHRKLRCISIICFYLII